MPPELSLEFIEKLPKTDLHVHLDGSIRVDTIIELARKQGVKLPTFDRADLFRQIFAGDVCNSLDDYLKAFDITLSVMQTEESLERTGYELAEDAWKENVRYIEVRYAPMLHTRSGLTLTDVVEATLLGVLLHSSGTALLTVVSLLVHVVHHGFGADARSLSHDVSVWTA